MDVTTMGGRRVTVTPNHPILTGRGWIDASEIHEGDDVVVRAPESSVVSAATDFDQVPALIEDVFAAFGKVAPRSRAVSSAQDFHGDGASLNGKVDVVGADGQLWRVVETLGGEQRPKLSLKVTCGSDASLPSKGAPGKQFGRLNLTAPRSVGGADVGRVAGAPPDLNAPFMESAAQGSIGQPEFLREAENRLSAKVATDEVIKVRYIDSAVGHVYDLSASGRAYFFNGIVVHNCIREFLPHFNRPILGGLS